MKRCAVFSVVFLMLVSCATLQKSRDENNALRIAGLIDAGNAGELVRLSTVPFLLDRDIVALDADVEDFWNGIVKAGFRLGGVKLEAAVPVSADSYKEFADSMDVRLFFSKYVGAGARVLRLSSGSGGNILLIVGGDFFTDKIYGFKGPF
jgi:hypothetical protein